MDASIWIRIVIAAIVLAVIAVVVIAIARRRRRTELRESFGAEYDRTIAREGDVRRASRT